MKAQTIKIIDFGISKLIRDDGKAIMNVRSGTAGYMAPELKGGINIVITSAIDMWAFGIILYELCVAYKPT